MSDLAELILQEAIPFFDRAGTADSYAEHAERRATQYPDNVNDWEEVFCLRLVRGDVEGALEVADVTRRAGRADGEFGPSRQLSG